MDRMKRTEYIRRKLEDPEISSDGEWGEHISPIQVMRK